MLIGRYMYKNKVFYGKITGNRVTPLIGDPFQSIQTGAGDYLMQELVVLAPCSPTKAVCVGINYRDHAEELKLAVPREPVLFLKPPSAVIGHGANIVLPPSSSQVDYEAELAVVIGRTCSQVGSREAGEYVFGYTCANDVTARDLQRKDGQWTRAKSFDTFLPLGPYIVTDLDPGDVSVTLRLNGVISQKSSTRNLVFGIPELVSFISKIMTLLPGDVILTGTPGGVGPLAKGDRVEVEIGGIGTLSNNVTS